MRTFFQNIVTTVVLIALLNCQLPACSCDPIPFVEAIEYADEIFVGTLIAAEKFNDGVFWDEHGEERINWNWRFKFKVEKKWIGGPERVITIYHQGHSCDLFFDIYQDKYLVYAAYGKLYNDSEELSKKEKNRLSTWLCSRTIYRLPGEEGNWFDEDVMSLNALLTTQVSLENRWHDLLKLGLTLIVVVLIGVWLRRRLIV